MAKVSVWKKPKTYKARVNWYATPEQEPIQCFDTQQEAIDWAKAQPPSVRHDIEMPIIIDWFTYNGNPREDVSKTRTIVDNRRTK